MQITIISNGCPECEIAKEYLAPLNPEITDWWNMDDDFRNNLMAEMNIKGGDPGKYPAVFFGGQFVNVDWGSIK